jgi:hypothetical protein
MRKALALAAVLAFGAVLAALAKGPPASPPPACKLHQGDRVILYGAGDDPDVLAWDSRFRLRDYHAASFDEAEQLLPHADVEPAGTRAIVVSCVADFVLSRLFPGPEDAVGVTILSGPDRGDGKWVLGADLRLEGQSARRRRL